MVAPSSQAEEAPAELISVLPAGALHHVFDYLEPRSLCAVGATCRQWRGLQGDAAANQARRCCSQHLAPDHTANRALIAAGATALVQLLAPCHRQHCNHSGRPCLMAASLPWVHWVFHCL